jgi:hypothetical protein
VLLVVLGAFASTLGIVAVALFCPLMMFVMMRAMMGGDSAGRTDHRDDRVDHERLQ